MIKVHFNTCGAKGGNDKIGKTKGGINTKVTVVCNEDLHPIYQNINLYHFPTNTFINH